MTNSILDQELPGTMFRVRGKIYVLTNKRTGEDYIGATASSLKNRLHFHIQDCKHKKKNTPLYKAMREHGYKNFTIEQIASCISLDELHLLESDIIIDRRPTYNRQLYPENIWS